LKRILELKNEFYSKDNIVKEFKIEEDATDNDNAENIVLTWQAKSSLITCEAIIRSALMRQESREAAEMVLFKQNVKEIKGALADYLKEHVKAEHNREFE
jgi:succinate dehydrogenase / fumarate reductase, flavoprotein subunit